MNEPRCNQCRSKHIQLIARGLTIWFRCGACNDMGIITADNMHPRNNIKAGVNNG